MEVPYAVRRVHNNSSINSNQPTVLDSAYRGEPCLGGCPQQQKQIFRVALELPPKKILNVMFFLQQKLIFHPSPAYPPSKYEQQQQLVATAAD